MTFLHIVTVHSVATIAAFKQTAGLAADEFGQSFPGRLLRARHQGSDTPVQNSGGGFLCWRRALEAIFASTSEEEKELLFGENARRVYRTT